LKSPTPVARAHPRLRRVRAGLPALVAEALVAEAPVAEAAVEGLALMAAVEGLVAMAAEGLVEDVGAGSVGRGVNGRAKARRNLSAQMGKPRN